MSTGLSTKELSLIENLEKHQNQRRLAQATGFSLGMINLLLKRLVVKGYVKVATLNGRTLKYMLTPRGFAEKVRRSYQYAVLSIRYLNEVKARIRTAIEESAQTGPVVVVGETELADLALEVLAEAGVTSEQCSVGDWPERWRTVAPGSLCLLCDPDATVEHGASQNEQVHILQLPGPMSNPSVGG